MPEQVRVQVLMPPEDAERFEEFCRARGHKKSTLIVRLVREHLDRERFQPQRELFRPAITDTGAGQR